MTTLTVFAALQWECRAVLAGLRAPRRCRAGAFRAWRAQADDTAITVVKTGVGVERAAAAVAAVLDEAPAPALLVSAGCAGGLDDRLAPGDLVLATSLSGAGTARAVQTDPEWRAQARAVATAAGLRVIEGPVACSATVLATVAAKRAAFAAGAVAVEMEGGPVAAAAAAADVPFLSARTVLDAADHPVPFPPEVIDQVSGTVRPFAVAAYVARHPSVLGELRALQQLQRRSHETLARFFRQWFAAPHPVRRQEVG